MSTNAAQDEFIQSLESDELTPEQAAQLLELGEEGDTGTEADVPETGGEPGATADDGDGSDIEGLGTAGAQEGQVEAGKANGEPDEASLTAENAVILAKDGKHTISYDKLVEARRAEQHARAEAAAARQELETLKAQAKAREATGEEATETDKQVALAQQAIDQGVDPSVFGDFSEEALTKGIERVVAQQVSAQVAAQVEKALQPLAEREQQSAADQHYGAIFTAHPDAESIVESQQFSQWKASLPSYARRAIDVVLDDGSAQEIIDVFTDFKTATGKTQLEAKPDPDPKPDPEAVKAAAKAAIANAKPDVPLSLTDFPGGKAGTGLSRMETMASMASGPDLLDAMETMAPEQIEDFLNRSL